MGDTGTHTSKNLLATKLVEAGLVLSRRSDLILKKSAPPGASPVYVETVYMAAVPKERRLPRVLIDESTQITESVALVSFCHV